MKQINNWINTHVRYQVRSRINTSQIIGQEYIKMMIRSWYLWNQIGSIVKLSEEIKND